MKIATMEGYDERTYGQRWGPYYDDIYDQVDDSLIDMLARHAGDPPRALELAVGTGRIALPLSERGVEVVGIDASEEMVARLRAKPGGEQVSVTIGDFATSESRGASLSSTWPSTRSSACSHVVRRLDDGESVVLPVEIRFAWPSELDLIARLAGLSLEDRFGWYDLRPFTDTSTNHISIYRKDE